MKHACNVNFFHAGMNFMPLTCNRPLTAFNTESLQKYLERSFQIVTAKASSNHLPTMTDKKTFVHICLAHFVKAVSYKTKPVYRSKEQPQFTAFCCSLLANANIYKNF